MDFMDFLWLYLDVLCLYLDELCLYLDKFCLYLDIFCLYLLILVLYLYLLLYFFVYFLVYLFVYLFWLYLFVYLFVYFDWLYLLLEYFMLVWIRVILRIKRVVIIVEECICLKKWIFYIVWIKLFRILNFFVILRKLNLNMYECCIFFFFKVEIKKKLIRVCLK